VSKIALLIGSARYPQEPQLTELAGPRNDVEHLAEVLANPEIGAFDVRKFVDVEHYTLLPVVESTLRNAQRDDLILLYYSGHGKLDFRGQLCLATVNTKLDALLSTSLPLPHVKSLVDNSRSEQIILILDCCFSGAAAKAFVRSAVDDQLKLTREESGTGLHILTSATEIQTSHEREREEGGMVLGVFTRSILEGIKSGEADVDNNGDITVTDLQRYVQGRVRGQKPRYWGLEASGDLIIARSPVIRPAELPRELQAALESPFAGVREGAVRELGRLLRGPHKGLALAAHAALTQLKYDDSRLVAAAAAEILGAYSPPAQKQTVTAPPVERVEAERLERKRREHEQREQAAREGAERRTREEAARLEQERRERVVREEAERQERERQAREKAEAGRRWLTAMFLVTIGWPIAWVICWAIAGAIARAIYGLHGSWAMFGAIAGASAGAIGGSMTALALWRTESLTRWNQILIVGVGWAIAGAIGGAIADAIAHAIRRAIGVPIAVAIAWAIAVAIAGAIGGSMTALALWRTESLTRWNQILIVGVGWAIAGAIAGAIFGALGGRVMLRQLSRASR